MMIIGRHIIFFVILINIASRINITMWCVYMGEWLD